MASIKINHLRNIAKDKLAAIFGRNSFVFRVFKSLERFFLRIIFPRGIKVNIGKGGAFRLHPIFIYSNYGSWGDAHNNAFNFMLDLCKDKSIIFDIGAHIGLYTLPVSKVINNSGICYAFEPAKINLRFLKYHLRLNSIKNVRIIPYAVGDKHNQEIDFYEYSEPVGLHGFSATSSDVKYKKTLKKQITLDEFIQEQKVIPEVIKIVHRWG